MDCGVDVINSTVTHIQLNFTTIKDFHPMVRIAFFYRYTTYRSFLLDVTEDFCAFIREDKPARVTNFFWPTLKDASNFAQGCPFQKVQKKSNRLSEHLSKNPLFTPFQDHIYYIKDYAMDMSSFPPILPTGDYRVDVELKERSDDSPIALVQIFAFIKRKSIAELLWSKD